MDVVTKYSPVYNIVRLRTLAQLTRTTGDHTICAAFADSRHSYQQCDGEFYSKERRFTIAASINRADRLFCIELKLR
jgi:hypothetical protein